MFNKDCMFPEHCQWINEYLFAALTEYAKTESFELCLEDWKNFKPEFWTIQEYYEKVFRCNKYNIPFSFRSIDELFKYYGFFVNRFLSDEALSNIKTFCVLAVDSSCLIHEHNYCYSYPKMAIGVTYTGLESEKILLTSDLIFAAVKKGC